MNRKVFLYIFLFTAFYNSVLCMAQLPSGVLDGSQKSAVEENQILYNGKVWRNIYINVKGDQFLFSGDFLPASLTINNRSFKNLTINYDIYNDEIIIPTNKGSILQLNKEMVDSFTLVFGFKTYTFVNLREDSLPGIKGYVNQLYKGKSALYIKYKKEIQPLAVDDKYDLFFRTYRIFFLKEGIIYQVTNKNDFLKIFDKDRTLIKDFIKKNRLKISKKEPESFIPVIRYYDSVRQ